MAGIPTGGGNPDWAPGQSGPRAARGARRPAARIGGDPRRQDDHRRGVARDPRRERVLRHAAQRRRSGARAGGIVFGVRGRGGGGARGFRARKRHRRLRARARELLRSARPPADARAARPRGHDSAGAEFRHRRLVRTRRRDVRAGRRRPARRGRCRGHAPGTAAGRARRVRVRRTRRRRRSRRPAGAGFDTRSGNCRGRGGAPGPVGLGPCAADAAEARGARHLSRLGRPNQSPPQHARRRHADRRAGRDAGRQAVGGTHAQRGAGPPEAPARARTRSSASPPPRSPRRPPVCRSRGRTRSGSR